MTSFLFVRTNWNPVTLWIAQRRCLFPVTDQVTTIKGMSSLYNICWRLPLGHRVRKQNITGTRTERSSMNLKSLTMKTLKTYPAFALGEVATLRQHVSKLRFSVTTGMK